MRSSWTATLAAFFLFAASAANAQPTVGIYSDPGGSNCSLSDTQAGFIEAYVVVRPGMEGVSAVEFSAPPPSCFTGTWVSDQQVPNTLLVGDSQSGISIALLTCSGLPVHVLTIRYFGYGTTPNCCEYPVLPSPAQSNIQLVDCAYHTIPVASGPHVINANGTCPCAINSAPNPPTDPFPNNGTAGISVNTSLTWTATDVDDNIAEFDVYLSTSSTPVLAGVVTTPSYTPPDALLPLTTYYWRVVARDSANAETSGPPWNFTTRALNSPPDAPRNPVPGDHATDVLLAVSLEWAASDIDGDTLTYDVYFGTAQPPPLVSSDQSPNVYSIGSLSFGTVHYWRVVAHDPAGLETGGPTWSFTTRPPNYPPNPPQSPTPPSGATAQLPTVTLGWSATDPDGDPLRYDVYIGTTVPPPLAASNLTSASFAPPGLLYQTTYSWRIVARDPAGAERGGPTWTLTTRPENYPPNPPTSPSPANNATGRPVNPTLAWQGSDPDGEALVYDVYFGIATPPPLVASNVAQASFAVDSLSFLTTYRWRVVARDGHGAIASSATWAFTTKANSPPNLPGWPSPPMLSTERPTDTTTLSWQCTDPDGQPLVFDVYFGTASSPPLVASNVATNSYWPGNLELLTVYYWKIVARDPLGAHRTGLIWQFTTLGNHTPVMSNPSPKDDAFAPLVPLLTWSVSDPDSQPLTFDVYFGTSTSPPRVAQRLTSPQYAPGALQYGATYYWRILAYDGITTASGSTWRFVALRPGDVDQDGDVTNADAACAFDAFLHGDKSTPACGGLVGLLAGDVNCDGSLTPADARCLQRGSIAPECPFCTDGSMSGGAAILSAKKAWIVGDTLHVRLRIADAALRAFGFTVQGPPKLKLVGVNALDVGFDRVGGYSMAPGVHRVGGYSLAEPSATTATDLVELRFSPANSSNGGLIIDGFVDDLAGAAPLNVSLDALVAMAPPVSEVTLHQNSPNPFNPQTTIRYELPAWPEARRVHLRILDVTGRVVYTAFHGYQSGGSHEVRWDGHDDRGVGVSSGVYFLVLDADGQRRTRRLVLLK